LDLSHNINFTSKLGANVRKEAGRVIFLKSWNIDFKPLTSVTFAAFRDPDLGLSFEV
jgi:hypothetical protein